MVCLALGFWDFRRFAKENPDVSWKLLEHVVELLSKERDDQAGAKV
jgi:hypothetical protein